MNTDINKAQKYIDDENYKDAIILARKKHSKDD